MLASIIAQTSQTLHSYFDPHQTNLAARRAGWVQRRSKLDGFVFLKSWVLGFVQHPQASLNQLSQVCQDLGVSITPQGIDERLTEAAVAFLREQLAQALKRWQARRHGMVSVLESFSEVYFQDSTIQALPAGLHERFAGSGGKASAAAVKIQLLFAFLSGNLVHLELLPGRSPDTQYQAHVLQLEPDSLLIQDLGFFHLGSLQTVVSQRAFFLSRWRADVQVFWTADAPQPLDMLAFLDRQTCEVAAYELYLGQQARLGCRLIAVCLPQAVADQRRRRLRADALRRGTTPSQRSLALCDWNVFLTNLPEERLSLRQLLACYSLRWQIELIFKLWKSQAALKHLAGLRPERVLCELYAKLIGLVLTHFLVAPLRFLRIAQQVEISAPKARQVLQDRAKPLAQLLGLDQPGLAAELTELTQRMLRFARKTKRKKHLSSLDRLSYAHQLSVAQLYPLA
jgi:hypothetical protein